MWLVMTCIEGCSADAIELARRNEWRAEAAIVGFIIDPEYPERRSKWQPTEESISEDTRFLTQRECLRALRRAMPARDEYSTYANSGEGWELASVEHGPDYVEEFEAVGWEPGRANMMRSYTYACFEEAPLVG